MVITSLFLYPSFTWRAATQRAFIRKRLEQEHGSYRSPRGLSQPALPIYFGRNECERSEYNRSTYTFNKLYNTSIPTGESYAQSLQLPMSNGSKSGKGTEAGVHGLKSRKNTCSYSAGFQQCSRLKSLLFCSLHI